MSNDTHQPGTGEPDVPPPTESHAGISAPFIRRPIATVLLSLALLAFGSVAFLLLPVAALPQVEFPTIQISASLSGASPEVMARSVAAPLERQLATIAGTTQLTSTSSTGTTQITMQFDLSRDIDSAAQDVAAAIQAARGRLPSDLPDPPTYRKVNPSEAPVLLLALTSDQLPSYEVTRWADTLAQQISSEPGVAEVRIAGEQKYAVRIDLNPTALAALGIGVDEVATTIQQSNQNQPKGQLQGPGRAVGLDANDQLKEAKAFRDVLVTYRNGAAVKLQDVARVYDGVEDDRQRAIFGDRPGVLLLITRQSDANVIDTVDGILGRLPQLTQSVPPTVSVAVVSDRSLSVRDSVHEVEFTLVLTVGLVVLTILLFLRNITATLIPATAVPLSLVGTFAVMYACGYSLNNLSLMGLTIAVGLVVDDAIVMLENIVRHIEEGLPPFRAALKGASEIGFTIVSITISLVAVFIPLLLMGGIVGRLFREFAVTVTAALIVSMLVSLTLTPMLASRYIRPEPPPERRGRLYRLSERAFDGMLQAYERSLDVVLRHQLVTLLATLLVMACTVALYIHLPKGFLPQEDTGQIQGQVEASPDVSFTRMLQLMGEVTAVVNADPDVQASAAFLGGRAGSGNTGRMFITLKPRGDRDRSADAVIASLRPKFARLQGVKVFLQASQNIRIGGMQTRSQYQFTLRSLDAATLNSWAPRIEAALRTVDGVEDVASDQQSISPRLALTVDRVQAGRLGVTIQSVDAALYGAFGDRFVSTIYADTDQYRVVMSVADRFQTDASALEGLYVRSSSGGLVPLTAFTTVKPAVAALSVNHSQQFPSVTLSFNLRPGTSLGQVIPQIQAIPAGIGAPPTISALFQGTAQEFQRSLSSQPLLIAAALFAVYVVLGVLYESFIHPITILSTIPSAGLGALLGLWGTGLELSVVAIIGIIMLIGIVKKNAIMMVDFAIQEERTGRSPAESIRQACLKRFRPIMMTSFAAILGGVPLALSSGYGAELRTPLGVTIVAGLLVSQVLTLYSTPVIYLYLDRLQVRLSRRGQATAPVAAE
ncbi:efflux RND transporter permease subunit [Oleisolibacter albus]|uniref:efflux RND transporter permease subunit n=1 Tax=Oleisolibacter albus TaxID=2171757 RepID=UPI000DF4B770|nr:efflux RND transporter permease subunit [Oleisolibacter albus]